jgi:phage terminase large subunit
MGRKPELVPNEDLMEGVNAGRETIPFARFDGKRCAQGLESLRSYRTEWDEKARAFRKTPEHNWASHGADAWRYLSLSCARRCVSLRRTSCPSAYLCRTSR